MNSYNHYAYGAVGDWIYRYAAGIDVEANDPGFHTIALHPTFDARLSSLDFAYESGYGTVRSSWNTSGKTTTWKLTIPPNTTGRLPLTQDEMKRFTLDGTSLTKNTAIHSIGHDDKKETYELPAGTYQFEVRLP